MGNIISIEIKNLPEVKKFLEELPKKKMQQVDKELVNQAFEMGNEVKMSIAGQRSEPTSVDTGRFLNSVDIEVQPNQARVFTEIEYAKFLEYGTSKFGARHHFGNTKIRQEPKIVEAIKEVIKQ